MPKKIRALKRLLSRAGFRYRPGKGSHTNWFHPLFPGRVTLSGKDGEDAKRYQEKDVKQALEKLAAIQQQQGGDIE